ncbi:Acetamidase/Formamidase [Rhodotorula diobovata]|uniref:Acetamidase/Formamidase n=1 Tax=Rhodotorula diobovata TaxID=5288 RepID=A0A5C5G633_9BASI|nr:Acetamidase/Formamidase [Rhodotorula diobovata]
MAPHRTVISIDPLKPAKGQAGTMNRWSHLIPAFAKVAQGEVFKVGCHEWTGGQIKNSDDADDIRDVDLTQIHYLSGPVAVEGAEAGDALVVDILDIQPYDEMPWGYTGIFEEKDGGLFATEFKTKASKAIWDFEGRFATSRHIPGVRFAGLTHPGILGTAPSAELLAEWNRREQALIDAHPGCSPAVALGPEPKGAYVGQDLPADVMERIAREGARTIPGREHGGNCDIKNLSIGSRAWLPVFVEGANLAVGDLHFSQGDVQQSFCGAIEQAGIITLKCTVVKGGVDKFALKQPIFLPSPIDPLYTQQLTFEGISVDLHGDGSQKSMCATTAYKQASLNAIAYLKKLGYTLEQAYLLLSAAPVESHVAALVDVPNAMVTMSLPPAIFDRDIMPRPEGLEKRDYGQCALRSDGQRSFDLIEDNERKAREAEAGKKQ